LPEGVGTLAGVLATLATQFPALGECIQGGVLGDGLATNLRGERFVRDPAERIVPGDCLFILSADAGG